MAVTSKSVSQLVKNKNRKKITIQPVCVLPRFYFKCTKSNTSIQKAHSTWFRDLDMEWKGNKATVILPSLSPVCPKPALTAYLPKQSFLQLLIALVAPFMYFAVGLLEGLMWRNMVKWKASLHFVLKYKQGCAYWPYSSWNSIGTLMSTGGTYEAVRLVMPCYAVDCAGWFGNR